MSLGDCDFDVFLEDVDMSSQDVFDRCMNVLIHLVDQKFEDRNRKSVLMLFGILSDMCHGKFKE